ncbi:MAG: hypothetical protein JWM73_2438, partial [Solirubrobacterales bacterium]|nr:hypothetical protein [Solirubrobacterales bacterium]
RLRSLADRPPADGGKVLSLFIDLDPRQFAAVPARRSAINSVLDDAHRQAEAAELDHAERVALRADLDRLRERLSPDDLPAEGAHGLAVFASGPAGLLEVLRLPRPVATRAILNDGPHLGPIADLAWGESWCVVLVSRGTARVFTGTPEALQEVRTEHLDAFGREVEFERHLRETAARVERSQRDDGWGCLLVGGRHELLDQFREMLGDQALRRLVATFDADVENITPDEVRRLATEADAALAGEHLTGLLDRFEAGLAGGGATSGFADTRAALEQRRVEALLLPLDGDAEHEVRAAVAQDASVHRVDAVQTPRFAGHEIGAVLRF